MDSVLHQDEMSDFTLKAEAQSFWVTIDNISVYVRRTDEGVAVDLYPVGMEMEDSLCSTWTLFAEATDRLEDYEHELKTDDHRRRAIANWPGLRPEPNGDTKRTEGGD